MRSVGDRLALINATNLCRSLAPSSLTRWYHYGTVLTPELMSMTKHRKTKEVMVQSTMRIPRTLWKRINKIADIKRLSMAQTVERALFCYCYMELPFDFEEPSLDPTDWKLALDEMNRNIERRRAEEKQRRKSEKSI